MQTRLTFYERQKIEYFLKCRLRVTKIAELLKRDHTVISREVKRNTGQYPDYFPYLAVVAQKATDRRSRLTNARKLAKDPNLRKYVEDKLKAGWSPEQIAGRIKFHPPPELDGATISYEHIYQFIYDPKYDGEYLYKYLRKAHYTRHPKQGRKPNKVNIPEKVSIHDRPEVANQRERFGDWETDLICFSGQKEAVSVSLERKMKLLRINKVANHTAEETKEALIKTIESVPNELTQTFTFDNGGENAKHTEIRDEFDIETYFCDTYSSWQKGGVENVNGLLRQYLPRKTNMTTVTDGMIYNIQENLNTRPRKSHTYLTPNELLEEYMVQTNQSVLVH